MWLNPTKAVFSLAVGLVVASTRLRLSDRALSMIPTLTLPLSRFRPRRGDTRLPRAQLGLPWRLPYDDEHRKSTGRI
jgi:hypothetical protein